MGKATGFLEFERKYAQAETPLERIKHFREFHTPLSVDGTAKAGWTLYGLWSSVLSEWRVDCRNGIRLPAA